MMGDWYARGMYDRGQHALQVPPGALRPSLEVRLQGHHPAVEGREVGPRPADGALQEGRRQVLRQHGLAPRQLLPVELEAPQVERRQHGPEARRGRRLAEGGQEARPALRRLRAPGRQLHLVPGQPRRRQDRARRPACPTTAPTRSTRTSTTSRPSPATRAGTATNPRWQQQWFDRIKELVDNYQPDLLYTDGGVPFGNEVGPQHDRPSLQRRRRAPRRQARGGLHLQAEIRRASGSRTSNAASCPASIPYPWQTDTSIGDWYYNRNWKFRAGRAG